MFIRARGRSARYMKRMSHIKIALSLKETEIKKGEISKKVEKTEKEETPIAKKAVKKVASKGKK
jgi:hypothetical protein